MAISNKSLFIVGIALVFSELCFSKVVSEPAIGKLSALADTILLLDPSEIEVVESNKTEMASKISGQLIHTLKGKGVDMPFIFTKQERAGSGLPGLKCKIPAASLLLILWKRLNGNTVSAISNNEMAQLIFLPRNDSYLSVKSYIDLVKVVMEQPPAVNVTGFNIESFFRGLDSKSAANLLNLEALNINPEIQSRVKKVLSENLDGRYEEPLVPMEEAQKAAGDALKVLFDGLNNKDWAAMEAVTSNGAECYKLIQLMKAGVGADGLAKLGRFKDPRIINVRVGAAEVEVYFSILAGGEIKEGRIRIIKSVLNNKLVVDQFWLYTEKL